MELIGLLNICKLPGMSSHEVVARVRRIIGMKRVGHAGTLDPSACGVLLVCLGQATRLADYISVEQKSYRAEFTFGIATDSADAEGDITQRADAGGLDAATVAAALPRFTGPLLQRPPEHSAVWIGGQRAYHLARRGEAMELPLREVTVYDFTPVRFQPGPFPRLLADITVSKGTYIRSLARDLGEALGVGATLSFLARTRIGGSRLAEAVTLAELETAATAGQLARVMQPADTPLAHIPSLALPPSRAAELYRQGNPMALAVDPGLYRVYIQGHFLGLGRVADQRLRSVVLFR